MVTWKAMGITNANVDNILDKCSSQHNVRLWAQSRCMHLETRPGQKFPHRKIPITVRWDLEFGIPILAREEHELPHFPTFSLADHHVAELTLPTFIKALHLNVIGGFRLQVTNCVPLL